MVRTHILRGAHTCSHEGRGGDVLSAVRTVGDTIGGFV